MSSTIWTRCAGDKLVIPAKLEAHRVVENQFSSSTRKLVDSLEEHDVLEDLIEEAKPPKPPHSGPGSPHYLLFTPFRYAPRQTRFNTATEAPIWYGSHQPESALTEKAYHTICFRDGSPELTEPFEVGWTSFRAGIRTDRYVDLSAPEFADSHEAIRSPTSYADTQALGSAMRSASVQAFSYPAARLVGARNVGVFTIDAFEPLTPINEEYRGWIAYVTQISVTVYRLPRIRGEQLTFVRSQFEVDGRLPRPAVA